MAPLLPMIVLLFIICSVSSSFASHNTNNFRPHELVLPLGKDPFTNHYVTVINQRTPHIVVKLVVDLGGRSMWVDCETGFHSTTYRPIHCYSPLCIKPAGRFSHCGLCRVAPRPGCNNNSCSVYTENPASRVKAIGELGQDIISLRSTEGHKSGRYVFLSNARFSCAPNHLLRGLADGARGMLGLGRSDISLPSEISTVTGIPHVFALCLTTSFDKQGVLFFGTGPYVLHPKEISHRLVYTPLVTNSVSSAKMRLSGGEPSLDYYINVKTIMVAEKPIPIDPWLLIINGGGVGGTKISTTEPYTALHSSIYRALIEAFEREAAGMNLVRTRPVQPFALCYNIDNMVMERTGPAVPEISLELEGTNTVTWRMLGANSMMEMGDLGVSCLAFVDGGLSPTTSIVIGGRQLEDNLLQFDLVKKRIGFSNSLSLLDTSCTNFNFTNL